MNRSLVRVLVVDDSVVARQLIGDTLKTEPRIDVIGSAPNGKVALEMIERLKPDVITLDLEMPEMDGLAVLDQMRKARMSIPVIVLSTLTERGAAIALDALSRGASDYLCKPSGQRGITSTLELIRSELIPRIFGLMERRAMSQRPPPTADARAPVAPAPATVSAPAANAQAAVGPAPGRVEVIVVGVSTGGPSALSELVPSLPADLGRPVLIVQHMPPMFTRLLSERLAAKSALKVREAVHGEPLHAGHVYVAPGNQHLRIAGSRRAPSVALDQSPLENGCRPSADVLFRSAVAVFERNVLALVLTGIGSDGTLGAEAVRRAGGQVWVQDAQSSVAWGMPGSVVRAGHCNRELALSAIAPALTQVARGKSVSGEVSTHRSESK